MYSIDLGEVSTLKDYKSIFEGVESTLIQVGSRNLPVDKIRAKLDEYKELEGQAFSDDECYWKLVRVVFYSGFRAATVTAKLPAIRRYFGDYQTVLGYGEDEIDAILHDPEMVRNERKIRACVENARTFRDIVCENGSFQGYVDSFAPSTSFENLMLLKEELEWRFGGLGRITTFHFLMDLGLPVLKPDRVICRIFQRLGLIESNKQLLTTVIQGRKFEQATGHPIRYVDIVFAVYGQVESEDVGIERGICLKDDPACGICGVRDYCNYTAKKVLA